MRVIRQLSILMLAVNFSVSMKAVSLDGTSTPTIRYDRYTFAANDFARGFVQFKNGINVPAGATVTLDINQILDGTISHSGRILLEGDLHLGPNAYIDTSSSGRIELNGHGIYLNGDLYANRLVSIRPVPSGFIDGQNHKIFVANRFPGTNFTFLTLTLSDTLFPVAQNLTVRNVRFENIGDNLAFPSKRFFTDAAPRMHTFLYNVTFAADPGRTPPQLNGIFFDQLHVLGDVNFVANPRDDVYFFFSGGFIDRRGTLKIHTGSRLYLGAKANVTYNANILFEDKSAILECDNNDITFFRFSDSVINMTNGTLRINGNVRWGGFRILGGTLQVELGSGISSDDMDLIIFPGSTLQLSTDTLDSTGLELIYSGVN